MIATCELAAGYALKILQRDVRAVAIAKDNDMPVRHAAAGAFPQEHVRRPPIPRRIAGVGHLLLQITIHQSRRADRLPCVRALALLELRLAHASRKPSWAAQAFVCRHMSLREAEGRAALSVSLSHAAVVGARQKLRALL